MGTILDNIIAAEAAQQQVRGDALRYNEGKPCLSQIDLTCLADCAKVLEFGAKKYGRNNWRKGMPVDKLLDSLLRHIAAIQRGDHIDLESGISHIGHIQSNAMFLGNKNNIMGDK